VRALRVDVGLHAAEELSGCLGQDCLRGAFALVAVETSRSTASRSARSDCSRRTASAMGRSTSARASASDSRFGPPSASGGGSGTAAVVAITRRSGGGACDHTPVMLSA